MYRASLLRLYVRKNSMCRNHEQILVPTVSDPPNCNSLINSIGTVWLFYLEWYIHDQQNRQPCSRSTDIWYEPKNILRASASRYAIQHNRKLAEYSGVKVGSISTLDGATRRFANRDMLDSGAKEMAEFSLIVRCRHITWTVISFAQYWNLESSLTEKQTTSVEWGQN